MSSMVRCRLPNVASSGRRSASTKRTRASYDTDAGSETLNAYFTYSSAKGRAQLNDDAMLEAVTNAVQNLVTDGDTRRQSER